MRRLAPILLMALTLAGVSTGPAGAEIIIKESKKHYPVKGTTGVELAQEMLKVGGENINLRHAIAATATRYEIGDAEITIERGRCKVTEIEVIVHLTYLFPKWSQKGKTNPKLNAIWDEFYAELLAHEATHGQIAKEGAKQLEKELKRISGTVALGCNDFGAFSTLRLNAISRMIKLRQDSFDARENLHTSRISRLQAKLLDAE